MRKHKKKSSEPEESHRSSSHTIAKLRSYGVAGGLTIAAIAVGIALYAQAGLLSPPTASQVGRKQTLQDDRSSLQAAVSPTPEQPSLNIPTEPSLIEPGKPKKQASDPAPQPQESSAASSKPGIACDTKAKTAATQARDRSLGAEKTLHKNNLASIGGIPKLLGKLGLVKDRTAAENLRHRKALESINEAHKQTLGNLQCSG